MKKIKLVKGTFVPDEALEVLADLITRKIGFHQSKSMSQVIRKGSPDLHSDQRVVELKFDLDYLKDIIKEAKEKKAMIKAESYIVFEIIENDGLLSEPKALDNNQAR